MRIDDLKKFIFKLILNVNCGEMRLYLSFSDWVKLLIKRDSGKKKYMYYDAYYSGNIIP
jgi:hypothetical protein